MKGNTDAEQLWESHVCVDDFIKTLAPGYAWLADYADTPQDPEWHAEGNVHIHVDWVLQSLQELLAGEAAHLCDDDKTVLTLAALLHDVGKPVTTRETEIQGRLRIAAPQHEAVGASYLFHEPIPFGLSADAWQQVIALTGYHHFPKRLVVRNRPHGEYAALSRRARPDLLYWLERADMQGRECRDRQEQLDIIELYRMECEAAGVWLQDPYQEFAQMLEEVAADVSPAIRRRLFLLAIQAYERGDIFMLEEGLARFYRFRESHPHVVVLCGASAAGKSHYARSQYPDYAVVSLDGVRESLYGSAEHQGDSGQVFQAAQEALRVHLRAQRPVVWDATNLRRDNRERIIGLARDYGAFVSLVALQKPRELLYRHNRERERQVPEDVLERQLRRFQLPDLDEAHEVLYVPAAV